jgi:hypothetical protein
LCAVWLFAVGSLRDFPESLAEGIDIPLCASGPQPRQFGGVCLTYEHRHHALPSYITSRARQAVTNIPARAAAGRRGQNVRYIRAVWQRPKRQVMSDRCRNMFPVVSSCCRFTRRARASLSLSLSSHRLAKQNAARSDGCFPSSPRLAALLTRLRLWLLVMDPVLAWLCWLWLVDEDQ